MKTREAGGHLVLITQGDLQTLSSTDETIISGYETYYHVRISSILIPLAGEVRIESSVTEGKSTYPLQIQLCPYLLVLVVTFANSQILRHF